MKSARRAMFTKPQNLTWAFEKEGLRLKFYLNAGSYATGLVRELVKVAED
jgi:tRNA pseudouridine13 synthase